MATAISIGQTGLVASAKQLDVIGNNLANSSTVGFKASSTLFASMMNQGLSSAGALSVGQGVAVSSLPTQFSQGPLENTGNVTDMAIDGEGFFIVHEPTGAPLYTRAGAFHIDSNNNLVDVKGYKVQGYSLTDSALSNVTSDILLQKAKDATASTKVGFGANLNESTAAGGKFEVSQNVYDSKGGAHTLTLIFEKAATSGVWEVSGSFDGKNGVTLSDTTIEFDTSGKIKSPSGDAAITINNSLVDLKVGNILATETVVLGGVTLTATAGAAGADEFQIDADPTKTAANLAAAIKANAVLAGAAVHAASSGASVSIWKKGEDMATGDITGTAKDAATITLGITDILKGATIGNEGSLQWALNTDVSRKLTGYASESAVRSLYADGYAAGELRSLSVDSKGVINGVYTNGQTLQLYQIALANFQDQSALAKSGNYFLESTASGKPTSNKAGMGGLGDIQGSSLEISNTDVSKEFISMITAQRAYQANAKVITTADNMLAELMNIKR
jgi:flagellar hook protein FlgE